MHKYTVRTILSAILVIISIGIITNTTPPAKHIATVSMILLWITGIVYLFLRIAVQYRKDLANRVSDELEEDVSADEAESIIKYVFR